MSERNQFLNGHYQLKWTFNGLAAIKIIKINRLDWIITDNMVIISIYNDSVFKYEN